MCIVFVFFLKLSTIFLGIAGTFLGYKNEIKATYVIYKNTSVIPGSRADVNRFPTDIFNTLPSKTSTTYGGIICPNVPDEAITPVASLGSYPLFSIVGKLINPIVTTVAPTIPVEAASMPPTTITE